MAMLAILILPLMILGFTAVAVGASAGASPRWPIPARTASPRSSTPTPRAPATTARPSPASPATRSSTTSTGAIAMLVGRFCDDHPGAGDRRLAGGEEDGAAVGRHLPDHGRLFVGLLVGVILIVGGLTFFPALALGPDRRASRDDRRHAVLDRIDPESRPWKPRNPQAHAGHRRCSIPRSWSRRSARPSPSSIRGR